MQTVHLSAKPHSIKLLLVLFFQCEGNQSVAMLKMRMNLEQWTLIQGLGHPARTIKSGVQTVVEYMF